MKYLTMQSNISDNKDEFEYANLLYKKIIYLDLKTVYVETKYLWYIKIAQTKLLVAPLDVEIINAAGNIKFL